MCYRDGVSLPIHVEAHAGYKANERPCRFTLDEETYQIETVEDQWHEPDALYFKVRATNEKRYLLRYDEHKDVWTLQTALDGAELAERPGIGLLLVDGSKIAQALRQVEYCGACHPAEAEIPFDWLLQDVTDAPEMTDFLMAAPGRCPNCRRAITEKTLVSRIDHP